MSRKATPYISLKPKNVPDAVWRMVVEAWKNGLSDREAAFRAGGSITASDIREWIKENPEIGELRANLQDSLLAASKLTIADAINSGDKKTAKWYLERKAADEFSSKAAVAFEGAAIAVTIEDKEKQLEEYIEQFNAE